MKSTIVRIVILLLIFAGLAISTNASPNYFDWSNKDGEDWMTYVKDQGSCGSCWAFTAVGTVEGQYNIFYGLPDYDLNLSEENLVSNCYSAWDCSGGWHYDALDFIKNTGITDEDCFPYVDSGCPTTCGCTYGCSDATCSDRCADWQNKLWKIDDYETVSSSKEAIKTYLSEKGPLATAMNWSGGYWDGEIRRCVVDSGVDHAVVITGYNETGGYWIIRNSWGSTWNGNGYFKLGFGECSVENYVYGATLATLSKILTIYNDGDSDLVVSSITDNAAWLSEYPISFTVPSSSSKNVNVTVDPTGMSPSTYHGNITISSNDPDNGTVKIPVTMIIENHPPTIDSVTDSPDPVKGGATITMTANGEADPDTSQTVYIYCDTSTTPTSGNTDCIGGDLSDPTPDLSLYCEIQAIADDSTHTEYCRLWDGTDYSDVVSTTYTSDSSPPNPSGYNPPSDSVISDSTPTFTFNTNEVADCFASIDGDESYDQMSDDIDCTSGQSTSHSCTMYDLGSDGSKTIYIACQDAVGNKDTAATNEYITYTLDTTPPTVTLNTPTDGSVDTDGDIIFNCSATDNNNLANISLYHNISGAWQLDQTKIITGTLNSTTFIINNIEDDTNFIWNCLAYDKAGNSDWGDSNRSITVDYIANETEGRTAIEQGINDSLVGGAIIYTDYYIRYLNQSRDVFGLFDKIVEYQNQTWAFNYVTAGESFTNMTSIGKTVNIWENETLTQQQIKQQVEGLINSTKT